MSEFFYLGREDEKKSNTLLGQAKLYIFRIRSQEKPGNEILKRVHELYLIAMEFDIKLSLKNHGKRQNKCNGHPT